ncbi:MAG: hypothetical protein AAF490_19930 [Chloroflexota bacterium]
MEPIDDLQIFLATAVIFLIQTTGFQIAHAIYFFSNPATLLSWGKLSAAHPNIRSIYIGWSLFLALFIFIIVRFEIFFEDGRHFPNLLLVISLLYGLLERQTQSTITFQRKHRKPRMISFRPFIRNTIRPARYFVHKFSKRCGLYRIAISIALAFIWNTLALTRLGG